MQTYLELEAQAAQLLKKAEDLRLQERAAAIADIKTQITKYGITAADLDLISQSKKSKTSSAPSPAKYKGPNGELWSGGRGRKPDWVRQVTAAGKSLEEFAIRSH